MGAFRLSGLLRLRRMEEDQAAAELARTTVRRQRAALRAEHARRQLAGNDLSAFGGDPSAFRAGIAARAALSAAVSDTKAAAESAREQEMRASERWTAARTRSKTLDKLEEKHEAVERAVAGHKEQVALDELATQRAAAGAGGAADRRSGSAPDRGTAGDRARAAGRALASGDGRVSGAGRASGPETSRTSGTGPGRRAIDEPGSRNHTGRTQG